MVDDGHDINIDLADQWVDYWLLPLLEDTKFNENLTLIPLTFDETETSLSTTTSSPCYLEMPSLRVLTSTPHSSPWRQTGVSGRLAAATRTSTSRLSPFPQLAQATLTLPFRRTLSNVHSFLANATGYKNLDVSADIPLTNLTSKILGPLNARYYICRRRGRRSHLYRVRPQH
jgi:hypothetical protein